MKKLNLLRSSKKNTRMPGFTIISLLILSFLFIELKGGNNNSFANSLLTNCGDSPQNIKAPIEYREFTLTPKFDLLTTGILLKISDGELRILGEFGDFIYNGKKFKSKDY